MYKSILHATRASAAHLSTMQRHGRALREAQRTKDDAAYIKSLRLYTKAHARYTTARNATKFPWEN
jgi:hypothetical protein